MITKCGQPGCSICDPDDGWMNDLAEDNAYWTEQDELDAQQAHEWEIEGRAFDLMLAWEEYIEEVFHCVPVSHKGNRKEKSNECN